MKNWDVTGVVDLKAFTSGFISYSPKLVALPFLLEHGVLEIPLYCGRLTDMSTGGILANLKDCRNLPSNLS